MHCEMYLETGGMHGACLIDRKGNIVVREDIGRHNAVDKAIGYAVRNRIPAKNLILLTTGRVSYEMLAKDKVRVEHHRIPYCRYQTGCSASQLFAD